MTKDIPFSKKYPRNSMMSKLEKEYTFHLIFHLHIHFRQKKYFSPESESFIKCYQQTRELQLQTYIPSCYHTRRFHSLKCFNLLYFRLPSHTCLHSLSIRYFHLRQDTETAAGSTIITFGVSVRVGNNFLQ